MSPKAPAPGDARCAPVSCGVTGGRHRRTVRTVRNDPVDRELDQAAGEFGRVRPRLFGIAYRMLGTVADAEDVVQDAWLRWQNADRSVVRDLGAFLATTTTRLAINAATSARVRREVYVGPWLPEPVRTSDDPTLGAERAEALDLAVLVLLERLSPTERAVYVLREAFAYPFRQIAGILETSEANARQLGRRARAHLAEQRQAPVDPRQHNRLLRAFLAAAQAGELGRLEELLAEDVISYSDGGGVVSAARQPVFGRDRVARFIAGLAAREMTAAATEMIDVNGRAAVLILREDEPIAVCAVGVSCIGIDRLFLVRNPGKLAAFSRSA